jgi:hypothetical protein
MDQVTTIFTRLPCVLGKLQDVRHGQRAHVRGWRGGEGESASKEGKRGVEKIDELLVPFVVGELAEAGFGAYLCVGAPRHRRRRYEGARRYPSISTADDACIATSMISPPIGPDETTVNCSRSFTDVLVLWVDSGVPACQLCSEQVSDASLLQARLGLLKV